MTVNIHTDTHDDSARPVNLLAGIDADTQRREPFEEGEFWHELMEHVYGHRQGDAKILVDAQDAKTGLAKTSAAVALAKACAKAFGYQLQNDDLTLSGAEYLRRYREHPDETQPSVLLLDELVGAGAGDARRAMSQSNVDLGRAWQLQRARRVVTICTLPDYSEADKRLKKLADFRVQTLREPFGSFRAYDLGTNFDGSGGIRFRRLGSGRTFFPDMGDDPHYQHLAEQKHELLDSQTYDADELDDGGEDEDGEEDTDDTNRFKQLARNILDDGIDTVVSTHSQTDKPYLNADLIRAEYAVSKSDARTVKALLEKRTQVGD